MDESVTGKTWCGLSRIRALWEYWQPSWLIPTTSHSQGFVMSTPSHTLASIAIPVPCSVSWDSMVGDDASRFCSRCRHQVYNLSAMSPAQAAAIVEQGDACVRFYRRPDGTMATSDCRSLMRPLARRVLLATVTGIALIMALAYGILAFFDIAAHGRNRDMVRNFPPFPILLNELTRETPVLMGKIAPPRNDK